MLNLITKGSLTFAAFCLLIEAVSMIIDEIIEKRIVEEILEEINLQC